MVLCFSMRSCGILQLVSYRLKKYIYFLSKISAWKGGFCFLSFFRLLWVWLLLLCSSPLSFCAPFLYSVWVRSEDCTVWNRIQSVLYRCVPVPFHDVKVGVEWSIINDLEIMSKKVIEAWLDTVFFCRYWGRTRKAGGVTGLQVLTRNGAFCMCRPSDASWSGDLNISQAV
jgi:hypothetical protein